MVFIVPTPYIKVSFCQSIWCPPLGSASQQFAIQPFQSALFINDEDTTLPVTEHSNGEESLNNEIEKSIVYQNQHFC